VRRFARGGDLRDLEQLEAVLDPAFRVIFALNGQTDISTLTREQYLSMIRQGKIGGSARTVTVESTAVVGALAFVRVKAERTDASFDGAMTLVNNGKGWRIVEDATVMRTKAAR